MRGEPQNCKSDIWSLGVTVIELAERYPPWYNLLPFAVGFSLPPARNFLTHRSKCLVKVADPDYVPVTFLDPAGFSDEIKGFVSRCLTRDVNKRSVPPRVVLR